MSLSRRREGYFTPGQRLGLLLLNYLPLLETAGILCLAVLPWQAPGWRLLAAAAALYLVPPLFARLILALAPPRQGVIRMGSAPFFAWWGLFNLQVVFCRFPALEEALRMLPGVYSAWLRLWGARVGRLTYWAADTRILDRSFLDIGDDVVFGAGVRLNAHVMARNGEGRLELLLADIVIGDRALIGGYSLLTTGTQIAPGECTRAFLVSPPFSRWQDGRRQSSAEGARQGTVSPAAAARP